jgi:hypothetical protein
MPNLTLVSLVLLPVLGCIGDPEVDDATYTRTIVRIADDGTTAVTIESITAAEQQVERETAASAHGLVAVESCENWNATKFFDQVAFTGNELCVIGSGSGRLDRYCRIRLGPKGPCARTWSMATRSVWTGVSNLWMSSVYHTGGACAGGVWSVLPANGAYVTVDPCVQLSNDFSLDPQ